MVKQLYYTSCENGLLGFSGFQFNAVTPGVTEEDMRVVEGLTGYQPPDTVPAIPTDEQIAGCPVALCRVPGVLARVVYTGADYSNRYGNYFAHALLGDRLTDGPPIRAWGSPAWVSEPVDGTDLPELDAPVPSGHLDPEAVAGFLSERDDGFLPALLTAVERAVEGDKSVLIVDSDTDRIAHWIAAVSYLSAPALVDALTFTTYHFRPARADAHLVGTVPGADIPADADAGFHLFDLTTGRTSPIRPTRLAELVCRCGPVEARARWARAVELGGDPYPAFAAVSADLALDADDLTAAASLSVTAPGLAAAPLAALPDADPVTGTAILAFARAVGAEPDPTVLEAWGGRVLGPAVLADPDRPVLVDWPALRQGVLDHFSDVAGTDRNRVLAALDALPIEPAEMAGRPELVELRRVARGRADEAERVPALAWVLRERGGGLETDQPLRDLWPDGSWDPAEAAAVLRALPSAHTGPVAAWVSATLVRPLAGTGVPAREEYRALCLTARAHPIRDLLAPAADDCVAKVDRSTLTVGGHREARGRAAWAVATIAHVWPDAAPPVRACLEADMALVLDESTGPEFAEALARYPADLVDGYLARVRAGLEREHAPVLAAKVFQAARASRLRRRALLSATLDEVIARWRRRDLDATGDLIRRNAPELAEDFAAWRDDHARRGPLRGWRGRR